MQINSYHIHLEIQTGVGINLIPLLEKGELDSVVTGKDAVKKIIRNNSFLSAKEIKSLLFSSIKKFINGNALDDDLTIVVAKFD